MSDLPIYIGPEEGMRQPHPWDGLDEMLEIAEKLDHSSPFRRIPKKRRAGTQKAGITKRVHVHVQLPKKYLIED